VKLLLDTHVWLWSAIEPKRLSDPTRSAHQTLGLDEADECAFRSTWQLFRRDPGMSSGCIGAVVPGMERHGRTAEGSDRIEWWETSSYQQGVRFHAQILAAGGCAHAPPGDTGAAP
jgi:hypothetical protein